MAHLPCVHTIELNRYLDEQDRQEALAEYRCKLESELQEETVKELGKLLEAGQMQEVKDMCEEYCQDFDTICALLMKDDQELFCNVLLLRKFTEGDIEALAKMAIHYFDFDSQVDEVIEKEKELEE